MKRTIFASALALTLMAAPAFAGTLKVEARDTTNQGRPGGSTEVKADYTVPFVGRFNVGGEVSVKQADNEGAVGVTTSVRVDTAVKAPLGFTLTPRVEVGEVFARGNNYGFYGVEVTASRPVYGPFGVTLGARQRTGFSTADLNDTRTQVGVTYDLGEGRGLALNFYNTNGLRDSTAVGVGFKTKF